MCRWTPYFLSAQAAAVRDPAQELQTSFHMLTGGNLNVDKAGLAHHAGRLGLTLVDGDDGENSSGWSVGAIFAEMDLNGDGLIDLKDFQVWHSQRVCNMSKPAAALKMMLPSTGTGLEGDGHMHVIAYLREQNLADSAGLPTHALTLQIVYDRCFDVLPPKDAEALRSQLGIAIQAEGKVSPIRAKNLRQALASMANLAPIRALSSVLKRQLATAGDRLIKMFALLAVSTPFQLVSATEIAALGAGATVQRCPEYWLPGDRLYWIGQNVALLDRQPELALAGRTKSPKAMRATVCSGRNAANMATVEDQDGHVTVAVPATVDFDAWDISGATLRPQLNRRYLAVAVVNGRRSYTSWDAHLLHAAGVPLHDSTFSSTVWWC
jgi:hypothetical protein